MIRLGFTWITLFVLTIGTTFGQLPRLQVQTSHTAAIRSVDVDDESAICLTASNDYTLRVWSLTSEDGGVLLRVLAGHQGPVLGGILNQNDSNQCVSWSADGTVRIWNMEDASSILIRLQDLPVGVDVRFGSNLIAVALGQQILFYDANNGASTDRPLDVPFAVHSLRFSPQGDYLVVGGAEGRVILYEVRTKRVVAEHAIGERPVVGLLWTDRQTWVGVSEAGDVGSAKVDGKVSVYKTAGKVRQVSRHSTGQQVALLDDKGSVTAVDVLNGMQRRLPKTKGLMSADAVCLLPAGTLLVGVELPRGRYEVRMFTLDGSQSPLSGQREAAIVTAVKFIPGTYNVLAGDNAGTCWYWSSDQSMRPIQITSGVLDKVQAILVTPDNKQCVIAGFGREQLGFVDLQTMDVQWISGLDIRGVRSMIFAPNGRLFVVDDANGAVVEITSKNEIGRRWNVDARFVTTDGGNTVIAVGDKEIHAIPLNGADQTRSLSLPSAATTVAAMMNPESGELFVEKAGGVSLMISLNGALRTGQPSVDKSALQRGVANLAGVRKGRSMLLAGADGVLRELSGSGSRTPSTPKSVGRIEGRTQCLDLSFDSKFVVAGLQDGTLQLIEATSSSTLATLYANRDGWVVATPDGRYDGDRSVESSLLVIVGRESRSLSQMPTVFREPNLLHRIFGKKVDIEREASPEVVQVVRSRPASIRFIRKTQAASLGEDAHITYRFQSNGQSVRSISVTEGSRAVQAIRSTDGQPLTSRLSTIRCSLRPGKNIFTVQATTEDGRISTDTMTIIRRSVEAEPPTLHALVVGVNTYEGRYPDLGFAADDAKKMTASIKAVSTNASVSLLVDDKATTSAVLDKLNEIAAKAKPQDNVVLYFAGHGAACQHQADASAKYCLMPYLQPGLPISQGELGIDSVFAYISRMNAGGVLVVLDACHSGGFAESEQAQRVMNQVAEQGSSIVVLASTAKSAKAAESTQVGGGLFTHLVSEGLAGRAKDVDGDVTAFSLANYVTKNLPGLCLQLGLPVQRAVVHLGASGSTMKF